MDHGYPQITDPTILKSLITQQGFASNGLPTAVVDIMQKVGRARGRALVTVTVTGHW